MYFNIVSNRPILYNGSGALGCLIRVGNFFTVGRQISYVVQIRSYLKLFVTSEP